FERWPRIFVTIAPVPIPVKVAPVFVRRISHMSSMSRKVSFPLAILLTAVGLWTARAQPPGERGSSTSGEMLPAPADNMPAPAPGEILPPPSVFPSPMSSWIVHNQANCCSPFGGDGPINAELYIDTGPSIPVAGGPFHHIMETGWEVRGGGRSLFFNPAV